MASSITSQLNSLSKQQGTLKGLIAIAAGGGISGDSRDRMRRCADATDGGMLIEASDSGIGEAFGKAAARIESVGQVEAVSAVGTDVVETAAAVLETL
jgi:hypothetical protein